MSKKFYVYVLARPDGTPFYVGKGKGRRVHDHEMYARSRCGCHKCNIIRKIWRNGGQVQKYIVFETEDEREAFMYECEMIALYGRDKLCNLTDGGEGGSNKSKEYLQMLGERIKALWNDPDTRPRMMAKYSDPEYRRNLSEKARTRALDPDERALRSVRARQRWQNPEYRSRILTKQTEGMTERVAKGKVTRATPEWKAKQSESIRQSWQNPEIRAKRLHGQKEAFARHGVKMKMREIARLKKENPEYRKRQSEKAKERWGDPSVRSKHSESRKKVWSDPAYRLRMSIVRKDVWARRKAAQEAQDDA
jgi:hypothetical protein